MKRFRPAQRVVIAPDYPDAGLTGTVVRLRRADDGAWVNLDTDPPDARRAFPANDSRARHVLLFPDECNPA
jgi:hypothetical protein